MRNENEELIEFLREKLSSAEASLSAREQMARCWKSGTDAEWEAAARMHPSTSNAPRLNKEQRIQISLAQTRIASKCRREVRLIKKLIEKLNQP